MPEPVLSASRDLQYFLTAELLGSGRVAAYVGARVYDNVPPNAVFPYLSFGPSDHVADDDIACIIGRIETVQIDVWSRDHGKLAQAREIADAVKAALHRNPGTLTEHRLIRIEVSSVRVFLDSDGITGHGIVTIEADIEEQTGA